MTKQCPECKTTSDIKDMTIKMGGLLCPKCRLILFQPYVDEEYFEEFRRRQKTSEQDKANKQKGSL